MDKGLSDKTPKKQTGELFHPEILTDSFTETERKVLFFL